MRPEDKLQKEVVKLLDLSGLRYTATANGAFLQGDAKQRAIRGKQMKELGVKNGVPDLLIFNPREMNGRIYPHEDYFVGLAIELKSGKNKPTPSQLEWHADLELNGWRSVVCYSIDEVLAVLKECYPHKFK